MSFEHDKMIQTLRDYVVPVLRERGFKGSFPHFRRFAGARIHLLTFQFRRMGGSFVVEVASCPSSGVAAFPSGNHIPPSKVTAWDIFPGPRRRLGSTGNKHDHWFRYDRRGLLLLNPYIRAAKKVFYYLDRQAEQWWKEPGDEA